MGLLNYLHESTAHRPGQTSACVAGAGMIASSPFAGNVGTSMVWCGTLLFAGGALSGVLKRVKAGPQGIEAEWRDDLDPGAFRRQIEEMRETGADPEAADLPGDDDAWNGARYRVAEQAIEGLLANLPEPLSRCEARLFVYDAETNLLMPSYRPPHAPKPAIGFRIGQGVTGQAFERCEYVYAEGDSTHDGTFDLTPEMQRRFGGIKIVAATPVLDRDSQPIGVLALSSVTDDRAMLSDDGYQEQVALAEKVGVVLIDVLRLDVPAGDDTDQ